MLYENTKQVLADLSEEKKAEKKARIAPLVSKILSDGSVIESIYDPKERKTSFIVFKDGNISYKGKVKIDDITYHPVLSTSDILKYGVVLLPSEVVEYGTTADLIEDVKKFINKYLQVSPFFEELSSYYVPFTWVHDKFNELPYLRALGDYGSGKTRFLQTIGSICYKPMFVGGASSVSPIFRIISQFQGTLILDEADYRFSDTTQEIIKILNQGFSKGSPVLRSEGDGKKFEVKAYNVYGPKIIATRRHFSDDALESRCLVERMERRTRNDIPLNLTDEFWEESQVLRNKLLMFRFRNVGRKIDLDTDIDQSIAPRLNQIIIPLLSIVDDPKVKAQLKKLIKDYHQELLQDKYCSIEAGVIEAVIAAQEEELEPTMKAVADSYNTKVSEKEKITSRKAGHIVRKVLRLQVDRGREGFKILSSNEERIGMLKEKYGLGVNDVNDVNVPEGVENEDKGSDKLFDIPVDPPF